MSSHRGGGRTTNPDTDDKQALATLAALGAVSFWGFVPTATRYLVDDLSPGNILVWRFLAGGVFSLLIILLFRPRMPARGDLPLAVGLGLFGVLGFNVPVAYGIDLIQGGVAAMLLGAQPAFIALLAWWWLSEMITPRMLAGLAIALLGVALIALTGNGGIDLSTRYLLGCLLVLTGALLYASYSVITKPYLARGLPGPAVAMLGTICGLPIVLPFGVAGFEAGLSGLSTTGWAAALMLALGASVLAPVLYNVSLSLGQASRAGLMLNLVPVVGVTTSVLLLGEDLTALKLIGGALVLSGVILATTHGGFRTVAKRA